MTSALTAPAAPAAPVRAAAPRSIRKVLLVCGIASSLLYVAATILGALRLEGYSSISQTVSELSAIGAPSRPLMVPLFLIYSVLMIAFGVGVWESAGRQRALRAVGGLLVAYGVLCLAGPFFPMHQREALAAAGPTLTDTTHKILTFVTVLLMFLGIGCGAVAFGQRFRLYSIATILLLVLGGVVAGLDAPRIEANLPTPWVGVTERINIGVFLLWVVVLATALLRVPRERPPAGLDGRGDSTQAKSAPMTR
jgi:hypothetical protein